MRQSLIGFTLASGSIVLAAAPLLAQANQDQKPAAAPPSVQHVQVAPDRKVTFQLLAPQATEAHVDCLGRQPMTRDERGVWSVTIGPLDPDIYSYSFFVDSSVKVPDDSNDFRKSPGEDLLEFPGTPPEPWDLTSVPHGSIHVDFYPSRTLGIQRRVHVYTPSGYETSPHTRYPVLYLLHGSGDDDANWTNIGCAQRILDNLIAQGKAKPMIVVMPNGQVPRAPGEPERRGDRRRMVQRFQGDLLDDLEPYVERGYRIRRGANNRALVGLSMGAIQAQAIGLEHPGRFGWVGMFSGAGLFTPDLDNVFSTLAANPARTRRDFRLIYISVGSADKFQTDSKRVDGWLTEHHIPHVYQEFDGGHEWKVWRHSLASLAPVLFR